MIRSVPKIAFVSPHCVVDFSNGAATATRDGLKLLAAQGFACEAFCGTRLDEPHEGLIQECLARQRLKYMVRKARIGAHDGRLIFVADCNLHVTLFENASTRGGWLSVEEVKTVSDRLRDILAEEPARSRLDLWGRSGFHGRATVGQALGHSRPVLPP